MRRVSLFVGILIAVSLVSVSCVTREFPITETYYETEYRTEVDKRETKLSLWPKTEWNTDRLYIEISEDTPYPTFQKLLKNLKNTEYYGYEINMSTDLDSQVRITAPPGPLATNNELCQLIAGIYGTKPFQKEPSVVHGTKEWNERSALQQEWIAAFWKGDFGGWSEDKWLNGLDEVRLDPALFANRSAGDVGGLKDNPTHLSRIWGLDTLIMETRLASLTRYGQSPSHIPVDQGKKYMVVHDLTGYSQLPSYGNIPSSWVTYPEYKPSPQEQVWLDNANAIWKNPENLLADTELGDYHGKGVQGDSLVFNAKGVKEFAIFIVSDQPPLKRYDPASGSDKTLERDELLPGVELSWVDAINKQVPYQVEKQRLVMETKKVPIWQAIFSK